MHARAGDQTTTPQSSHTEASGTLGSRSERIVVGVDGSASSTQAVDWATNQAARCGGSLLIVAAWEPPVVGLEAYEYGPPQLDLEQANADRAQRLALAAAERAGRVLPAERVHTTVLSGGAAEVLIGQSRGADLLVVGSRGLGGFRGLLLGSVSQQCASHASCPVVVVRSEKDDGERRDG